jgi:hypothetical protein
VGPGECPAGLAPLPRWVYQNATWFYNDTSPWGAIVHHYGRWARDAQIGWMWTPAGEDFSPAWVTWNVSPATIGWEPLAPEIDIQNVAETPDDPANWIFVQAAAFGAKCASPVTQTSLAPAAPAATSRIVYRPWSAAQAPVYAARPQYQASPARVQYQPFPYPVAPVQPNVVAVPVGVPAPVPVLVPTPNSPSPTPSKPAAPPATVSCPTYPCKVLSPQLQDKLKDVKVVTPPQGPGAPGTSTTPGGVKLSEKVTPVINPSTQDKLNKLKVAVPNTAPPAPAGGAQPAGKTPGGINLNSKVTPLPGRSGAIAIGANKSPEPPLKVTKAVSVRPVISHVTVPAVKTMSGQFSGGFSNKMYQPPVAPKASFVSARPNFGNAGFAQHAVIFAPQRVAPSFGGGTPGQGGMMMGRSSFSSGGPGMTMGHPSFGGGGFGGGHGR